MIGLVADIGGTNARFALAPIGGTPHKDVRLATAGFDTLEAAVKAAVEALSPAEPIAGAVLAIAAPVVGRRIRMTNASWEADAAALARRFGWRICRVINDFAAIGHALATLAADGRLIPLDTAGNGWEDETVRVVLGPGTGLGVAAVIETAEATLVQATEGGHVAFAPETEEEWALACELKRRHGRVSAERILSGPGLLMLYRWLGGRACSCPEAVAEAARAGKDDTAVRAARWFLDVLARFAGDMVMSHGAWGGALLTGGVWQGLYPLVDPARFRQKFAAKGRYERLLQHTAIAHIDHPDPGLLGSAQLLARLVGKAE